MHAYVSTHAYAYTQCLYIFNLLTPLLLYACRLQQRFAYNSIDDVRCPSDDKRDQSRSPMATVVTMATAGEDVGSAEQPKRSSWPWGRTHSLRRQSTYVTCAYPDCQGSAVAAEEKPPVAPLVAGGVEPSPKEAWRCTCERCTTNHQNISNQQQQNEQEEQQAHHQEQQLHDHQQHIHHLHRQEQSDHHHQHGDDNHPLQHHDHLPHHQQSLGFKSNRYRSSGHPTAPSAVRILQPIRCSSAIPTVGSGDYRRRSSSSPYDIQTDGNSCCPPDIAGARGSTNTW